MGDFRVRYGLALGPYGNVAYASGALLFPANDATPDVTDGSLFLTNNSSGTTISYFDVRTPGGLTSLDHQGKRITIIANDTATTIGRTAQLHVSGTGAALTTGQTITFIYYNSAWYEESASELGRESVKTISNLAAAATVALNVAGVQVCIITPSGGATVVTGLSSGVIGQTVFLMKNAVSAGTAVQLTGFGNFVLAGTTAIVMDNTGVYGFVCDNGTRFRSFTGLIAP